MDGKTESIRETSSCVFQFGKQFTMFKARIVTAQRLPSREGFSLTSAHGYHSQLAQVVEWSSGWT
eukprot:3632628-Amphidinium_carterae.2